MFQIGELANGLSVGFLKEYNKISWKQIIGMRNRIVHGYDTINLEIVWNTAVESIPELKSYCKEILGQESFVVLVIFILLLKVAS